MPKGFSTTPTSEDSILFLGSTKSVFISTIENYELVGTNLAVFGLSSTVDLARQMNGGYRYYRVE